MVKLFLRLIKYGFLIILSLEILVRLFYLGKDYPTRFVDDMKVEKWVPNQNGYNVTGNRRQNFSEYKINSSGFNSYREFNPTADKKEIALVGDSFIEGFHTNYYNSIGKKIEDMLPEYEAYEYGYAGYDFADQLHLMDAYRNQFNLIDHVFIKIKFTNDLTRGTYEVLHYRMKLESPIYKLMKKSKLIVYAQNIGLVDPIRDFVSFNANFAINLLKGNRANGDTAPVYENEELDQMYLDNFKSLVSEYNYDMQKNVLIFDSEETPDFFISYLKQNGFKYFDYGKKLRESKAPTNLIYDMHWNNHGRKIIASTIAEYVNKNDVSGQ